jgi:hypothetical protein
MRKFLLSGALAAIVFSSASPAHAYGDAPWCLKASIGLGVVSERCDFPTFETCRDERPMWGNGAFCVQNSRYLPYWQGRIGEEQASRKRLRKAKHRPH